ncbi:hypothetical protein SS1G_01781 [Sclerotinia sclerotiorum 1980 UF-70]|uniref:Lipoyl-binding domain-containing protein n=1 Tax=Sclerotinia sclerotiorum (strain ATCC 18683 / 1980 / Ss-1) TaxID=665079 RepID=A7E903_SCLS1|nr:hypothetical protein SS1G_01781 [Sclerotinia sclerotiorum 1980 UF-70]EDN96855.1 hypothetical protein SS1G_01781 [Sclerotinia sclerotiorum 1980 UF-70]
MARQLADECHVPTLPALQTPTNDISQLQHFASSVGYPIIIKAVDGGGGRGIRIVIQEAELEDMLKAALRESPSKKVFAEKAAIDEYRHVEVQIIGDGKGGVRHLWERECSIQRRFQKVVEFAPSAAADRDSIARVVEAALRMAKQVRYLNGSNQTRDLTESPSQNFSISPGKISSFHFPSGNGIRVDTHLHPSTFAIIGTDFDSLLAKLIIAAPTWLDVIAKAKRALDDTSIIGIETNLNLLRAIMASDDFRRQKCDTRWLEKNLPVLLESSRKMGDNLKNKVSSISSSQAPALPLSSNVLFRPRDAWDISLTPENSKDGSGNTSHTPYHLQITRILTNNFPSLLKANILFTSRSSSTSSSKPTPYTLSLTSSTSSSSQQSSKSHRLGNLSNQNHIIAPFPGKLIEIYVEIGDKILAGQAICVIRQMKMEVEIRSKKGGIVTWVLGDEEEEEEWEVGLDVREGVLILFELIGKEHTGLMLAPHL